LNGDVREDFLNMKVADLVGDPATYLDRGFVRGLSRDKNFELASATVIMGRKLGMPLGSDAMISASDPNA
jgi:hypothetical protein